jgi:hypothetical protein
MPVYLPDRPFRGLHVIFQESWATILLNPQYCTHVNARTRTVMRVFILSVHTRIHNTSTHTASVRTVIGMRALTLILAFTHVLTLALALTPGQPQTCTGGRGRRSKVGTGDGTAAQKMRGGPC